MSSPFSSLLLLSISSPYLFSLFGYGSRQSMSDLLSQIAAVLSFPFCIVKTHAHSCWASQSVCYLYCHTSCPFTTISPLLLPTSQGGREAPAGPDRGAPSVAEHQDVVECVHPYSQYSGATTDCGEVISLNTLPSHTQKWGSPKFDATVWAQLEKSGRGQSMKKARETKDRKREEHSNADSAA